MNEQVVASAATPPNAPVTYPHVGTVLIAVGIGVTTFTADAVGLPRSIRGLLAGIGAAASAMGLFLLGRSSV